MLYKHSSCWYFATPWRSCDAAAIALLLFSVLDPWLNIVAYAVRPNSDTGLSYGFYAEYYAANNISEDPTETKGSVI